MPVMKEILNQRDKEIYEMINILMDKGFTLPAIYEKLHHLTSLKPDYIKEIRFRVQRSQKEQNQE